MYSCTCNDFNRKKKYRLDVEEPMSEFSKLKAKKLNKFKTTIKMFYKCNSCYNFGSWKLLITNMFVSVLRRSALLHGNFMKYQNGLYRRTVFCVVRPSTSNVISWVGNVVNMSSVRRNGKWGSAIECRLGGGGFGSGAHRMSGESW